MRGDVGRAYLPDIGEGEQRVGQVCPTYCPLRWETNPLECSHERRLFGDKHRGNEP